MKTALIIIQVLLALALIASVILQSGKAAGLSGAIAGGAETFFGKKKGIDDFLSKITIIVSSAFFLLTLIIAML